MLSGPKLDWRLQQTNIVKKKKCRINQSISHSYSSIKAVSRKTCVALHKVKTNSETRYTTDNLTLTLIHTPNTKTDPESAPPDRMTNKPTRGSVRNWWCCSASTTAVWLFSGGVSRWSRVLKVKFGFVSASVLFVSSPVGAQCSCWLSGVLLKWSGTAPATVQLKGKGRTELWKVDFSLGACRHVSNARTRM